MLFAHTYYARLTKVVSFAQEKAKRAFGMGLDTAEGITAFIGYVPGSNASLDLPCISKAALPDVGTTEPSAKRQGKKLEGTYDEIVAITAPKAEKRATAVRGYRSIELLRLVCQQLKLVLGKDISEFFATEQWWPKVGKAPLRKVEENLQGHKLNMLSLCSDQGSEILMAVQLSQWLGVRMSLIPDHNHRDNNDSNFAEPSTCMCIELIGKITNGPYGRGAWFKSIQETIAVLEPDEETCAKYISITHQDAGVNTVAQQLWAYKTKYA